MQLPQRKPMRIPQFDYASQHAYFITICTKNRQQTLARIEAFGTYRLSSLGVCAEKNLKMIPHHFPEVQVEKFVVMPNHVHMMLTLGCNGVQIEHTLPAVIQAYKASVSRWAGFSVWQRSFYDHVVRNEADYQMIWQYIENNPLKWELDRFYTE